MDTSQRLVALNEMTNQAGQPSESTPEGLQWREGIRAFVAKRPKDSCPYQPPTSSEAFNWNEGYEFASYMLTGDFQGKI